MAVIALKVISSQTHPHADSLRIYTMTAPGYDEIQIIANLENIYQVGDIVAVALVNSILKDGTKIKAAKLRGINSFGMALGKVQEPVGKDISPIYCQPSMSNSVSLQKWPSVELFHNLYRNFKEVPYKPTITYRAKVKLDGTNSGVQIFSDGRIAAQSRNQVITPEQDNAGFANWVNNNLDFFSNLASTEHITIFGEWCGKGIQKRTAISQIDRKVWVVFAIQYGGVNGEVAKLEVRPEVIRNFLPNHSDIFVLPFYKEAIGIDFGIGNREKLTLAVEQLNSMVKDIEANDSWVKNTFGVEGIGEGFIFYPQTDELVEKGSYSQLMFKAKGEKHQVVKTKKPVQVTPEKVSSIQEFVEFFVTVPRLEQGVREACENQFNIRKMGDFLQWFVGDVKKESVAELAAAELTWKEVNKAVMRAARNWYQDKVKEI